MKTFYEVIVGNVGKVHEGHNAKKANDNYQYYVRLSQATQGHVSGEDVSLWKDNEPIKTHDGTSVYSVTERPRTMTLHPTTKLEKHVAAWIRGQARDGYQDAYQDLLQHGCQSGMVSHLIYYHDTVKFYKKYQGDINALLVTTGQDCGVGPDEMFGEKWDKADPLALDTMNQNLLAWFGFEEATRQLVEREGVEI